MPTSCSVERASYSECRNVCDQAAGPGGGTCCYCEDGDWKKLYVWCGPGIDAGVDAPDAAATDALDDAGVDAFDDAATDAP